jgi:hypothetical protein
MTNFFEFILSLFGYRPPVKADSVTKTKIDRVEEPVVVPSIEAKPDELKPSKPEITPRPNEKRKWRLTYYYVSEQALFSGPKTVPVYAKDGTILDHVEPAYFAQMSLEGTGKMRDGRLFNVAGATVSVKHADYSPVWEHHKKYLSKRPPGYSGLVVKDDKVVKASAFHIVSQNKFGVGYGTGRGGVPYTPFKTIAADVGATNRSEPKWKGKGGICPPGTRVFIETFVGVKCPDGSGGSFVHDGWFTVNDTGGGIFGKHFDIFVGTKSLSKKVSIPGQAFVTWEGIETRVLPDVEYTYGLYDV